MAEACDADADSGCTRTEALMGPGCDSSWHFVEASPDAICLYQIPALVKALLVDVFDLTHSFRHFGEFTDSEGHSSNRRSC